MKKEPEINRTWFDELLRDIIAFGSLPFFLIVVIRTLINNKITTVTYQLGLSLILICIFYLIFWKWKFEIHAALSLPLVIFVSLYYQDLKFTIFVLVIFILLLASLLYLKYDWKKVSLGLIMGGMVSWISWLVI